MPPASIVAAGRDASAAVSSSILFGALKRRPLRQMSSGRSRVTAQQPIPPRRRQSKFVAGAAEPVGFLRRVLVHGVGRCDDGPVPGAAAEVAGQRVIDIAPARPVDGVERRVFVEREQGHDEARRAESALGPVRLHERALHRVQPVSRGQRLHREQFRAIQGRDETDTGIDRREPQALRPGRADHDGTGAAVTFGATLLGAGPPQVLAQVLEDRPRRVRVLEFDDVAVEDEADDG